MDFKRNEILDDNISYHTQFLNEFDVYHKNDMKIIIKIFGESCLEGGE
jgi:hypothetical protein